MRMRKYEAFRLNRFVHSDTNYDMIQGKRFGWIYSKTLQNAFWIGRFTNVLSVNGWIVLAE
jgi:hypothetical protein